MQCNHKDNRTNKPEKLRLASIAALHCYDPLKTTKTMTTQYTLPYDPVFLLSANTRIKLSGDDTKFALFKGAGGSVLKTISGQNNKNIDLEVTDETLFIMKKGVPTAFKRQVLSGRLVDGTGSFVTDGGNGYGSEYLSETLAVSYRSQISGNPMALLIDRAATHDNDRTEILDSSPFVLIFEDKMVALGPDFLPGLKQERLEVVDAENNEFWEAAFEYDINQDGYIPEYRAFEQYTRPTKDEVNGKVIEGKKKDVVLEGGRKNDHIDGKKGNDIVYGKKGDDALFGSKGRDQIYGSNGDDYLSGGSDDDILEGGSGADVFALSSGRDRIIDFNIEDGDKIAIQGHDVAYFTVTPTEFGSLVSVEGYGSLEIDISLEGIDLVDYVVQAV